VGTLRWHFVAASLGAHALALAVMARVPAGEPTLPASIVPPMEVSVVDAAQPPAPAVEPPVREVTEPARTSPPPPRRVASVTRPSVPPSERPASPPPEPPAPEMSLGMRRDEPPVPPPGPAVPSPRDVVVPAPPRPPDNQLRPEALGGPIQLPSLPGPLRRSGIASREERLGPGVVAEGGGRFKQERTTFTSHVDEDGSVHFKDKGNVQIDGGGILPIGFLLGGHFDITEALMRMHGEDPYRYEKEKFMEVSRGERMQMAKAARAEKLKDAVVKTPPYLEKIWRTSRWTPVERRLALFSLWDEVNEEGDPELVETGAKVRQEILWFIQRKLPAGSPDAFTPAELDTLNAHRKSKARFAPY
jgi:hypothetical protein